MQKTTVYFEAVELQSLKRLAVNRPKTNLATLIRQAVREFLARHQTTAGHPVLRKLLRAKPRAASVGDPVVFQQAIRSEWDRE